MTTSGLLVVAACVSALYFSTTNAFVVWADNNPQQVGSVERRSSYTPSSNRADAQKRAQKLDTCLTKCQIECGIFDGFIPVHFKYCVGKCIERGSLYFNTIQHCFDVKKLTEGQKQSEENSVRPVEPYWQSG